MSSGFSGGRLSGSAEDAKVKGTGKVGGAGKRKKEWIDSQFPPVLFSFSQFSGPDYRIYANKRPTSN